MIKYDGHKLVLGDILEKKENKNYTDRNSRNNNPY